MQIPAIPENTRASIRGYFGDAGDAWLARLPDLIAQAAARWRLTLSAASDAAGTGYVAFARDADGCDVVLKVAYPEDEHLFGVAAMRVWDGQGSVRLLDTAARDTQVLMERVQPGTHLYELQDEAEEARIVAGVMRALRRPPPAAGVLPPHRTWSDKALRRIRENDPGPELLPRRLIRALEDIVDELIALDRAVVLHGDLHHENVLYDEARGWLAIDPKGLIGDPALEVGRYLGNQLSRPRAGGAPAPYGRLVDTRLEVLARELDEPLERLRRAAAVDVLQCMGWELERPDFDRAEFAEARDRALHLLDGRLPFRLD